MNDLTIDNNTEDRKTIRRLARERRRSLSPREQALASTSLRKILIRQPIFIRSKTIGGYLANDGEIDPAATLHAAMEFKKRCFLPVIQPLQTGKLWFLPFGDNESSRLTLNQYGIPEPRNAGKPLVFKALDVVLMPLVAFDRSGARLGMGGGFYDRSFAFKRSKAGIVTKRKELELPNNKPRLIGLAHHAQEWEKLPTECWDIPLDAIVTDRGVIPCSAHYNRDFLESDFLENDL